MYVTSYKALQILQETNQGLFELQTSQLSFLPHVAAKTQTWLMLELPGEL